MKNYVELSDEVRKYLGLEKNIVYNLYTLPTLKYPVKFTDLGLVHAINDSFMDYPILCELLLGSMELKKVTELKHREVAINDKLSNFYPLFHMDSVYKKFKEESHKNDFSAQDVVNVMQYDWAEEILNDECFNADILAPFIINSIDNREYIIDCMQDFYHYVLEYIFNECVSIDICEAMVYNDCVDYINESNIDMSEDTLTSLTSKYFDWSEPYEDALEYLFNKIEGGNKE